MYAYDLELCDEVVDDSVGKEEVSIANGVEEETRRDL